MSNINGYDLVCRIDTCLKAMGMNRDKLAAYIGKNRQVFTDWKNVGIIPKADDLYKIAKFLGVPMEWLLTGEENIPDKIAVAGSILMTLDDNQQDAAISMLKAQADFWTQKKEEK